MTRWSMVGVVLAAVGSFAAVTPVDVAGATTPPADAWTSEYDGAGNASFNAGEAGLTPSNAAQVGVQWTRSDDLSTDRAPSIVGGVGYEVVNQGSTDLPSHFEAFSVSTGATLWSTPLPTDGLYLLGESIIGHVAVMSFDGHNHAGGVSAVDLTTHRLLWSRRQPPAIDDGNVVGNKTTGPVLTDGLRVYMYGGTNTVNTFRLSDGAPQWRLPLTNVRTYGIALGNKVLYTGGDGGVTAYDSTTGRLLWTAPGVGAPVVAGGRVFTAAGPEIIAVAADGCGGATTCGKLWDTVLPYDSVEYPFIGGVDGSTGYLTYTDDRTGGIVRFSAVSGRVLWRAPIAADAVVPVRGGSTVWTVAGGTTLVGFSTTATTTTPLRSIVEPTDRQEGSQSLAIAGGEVFVRSFPLHLTAYGLPTG